MKLGRGQLMLLLSGLGAAIALAPQLVVPTYGLGAYLVIVTIAVVALAATSRRSIPRVPRINKRRER